jgi:superoxide dismutase, Cu-Zn family
MRITLGRASSIVTLLILFGTACQQNGAPEDNRSEPARLNNRAANREQPTAGVPTPGTSKPDLAQKPRAAAVTLESASTPTAKLDAQAKLTEQPEGVKVEVDVSGAPPGKKAVHIYEQGACGEIVAKKFRPKPSEQSFGELGNIDVGPDGNGKLEITLPAANLRADNDPKSLLGRAIVIQTRGGTKKDPGGPPLACGEIATG